jgi:hypothetical protein
MNVSNRFTSWFAVTALAAGLSTGLGVGTVGAAVIDITDFSFVPDGTSAAPFQSTDLSPNLLNPAVNDTIFYVVSTFTFGTASDAHLQWQFFVNELSAGRMGVEVQDTGLVQTLGTGSGVLQNISPTTDKRSSVNLNQDMAGQSITLLAKFFYNSAVSSDLGARTAALPGGSESTADDTIMNVWINPDMTAVEGDTSSYAAMIGNGDMYAVWNSTAFNWFRQTIQNQNTPVTSGTSFITNTVILTGTDATFANALAVAVPEPGTWAMLGAGAALAGLRLARRRSNVKA